MRAVCYTKLPPFGPGKKREESDSGGVTLLSDRAHTREKKCQRSDKKLVSVVLLGAGVALGCPGTISFFLLLPGSDPDRLRSALGSSMDRCSPG